MSRKLPLRSGRLVDGQTLSMAIRINQLEEKLSVSEIGRGLLQDELAYRINLARNSEVDPVIRNRLVDHAESVLTGTDDDVSDWFYTANGLLRLVLNWRALLVPGVDDHDQQGKIEEAEAKIIRWIDERTNKRVQTSQQ